MARRSPSARRRGQRACRRAARAQSRSTTTATTCEDAPSISDAEYDAPVPRTAGAGGASIRRCVTPDSPTQRVGGAAAADFDRSRIGVPMLSLNNAFTDDEVEAFDRRVARGARDAARRRVRGRAEVRRPRDQPALRARRVHGRRDARRRQQRRERHAPTCARSARSRCGSRGDAHPPLLEVRGEVLMLKRDFEALNAAQAATRREDRSSTRATPPRARCASSIPRITASRRLAFFAYGIGAVDWGRHDAAGDARRADATAGDAAISRSPSERAVVRGLAGLLDYYRQIGARRAHAALRDRRRRLQGQRPRAAGAAGLRVARAALRHRAQISRRGDDDRGASASTSRSGAPARSRRWRG